VSYKNRRADESRGNQCARRCCPAAIAFLIVLPGFHGVNSRLFWHRQKSAPSPFCDPFARSSGTFNYLENSEPRAAILHFRSAGGILHLPRQLLSKAADCSRKRRQKKSARVSSAKWKRMDRWQHANNSRRADTSPGDPLSDFGHHRERGGTRRGGAPPWRNAGDRAAVLATRRARSFAKGSVMFRLEKCFCLGWETELFFFFYVPHHGAQTSESRTHESGSRDRHGETTPAYIFFAVPTFYAAIMREGRTERIATADFFVRQCVSGRSASC